MKLLILSKIKNHNRYSLLNIYFLSSIFLSLILGCSHDPKPQEQKQDMLSESVDTTSKINEMAEFQFHNLIANIPSPVEVLEDVAKSDSKIDKSLVNPSENEPTYQTSAKRAYNYGVYAADLSYLSAYGENNDIMELFQTAHKLAELLDADKGFEKIAGKRMESGLNNKDSLRILVDEVYKATDDYLISNKRLENAAMMVTGGWIESQYLICMTLKKQDLSSKNELLYNKVYEQKFHLANLILLLKEFTNKEEVRTVLAGLEDIQKIYSGIKTPKQLDYKTLEAISDKIAGVRKQVVS